MTQFQITGRTPLYGSVRIGGAKNASFKVMIASLLGDTESRILNFSRISDVTLVSQIISYLGAKVTPAGERALFIDPSGLTTSTIHPDHGEQGRFSTMFIPVLLHKFGKAQVPAPGGDKIGRRPLERHFDGLQALGASVSMKNNQYLVSAPQLVGAEYRFEKNSHTGTETLLMAAAKAKGRTILQNAAIEPEIDDLISFLNKMGARISRPAKRVIKIEGVEQMGGAIHKLLPDRNEAVSYACAALATQGDVIIENARAKHLRAFLHMLSAAGAGYEVGDYGIRFYYKGPLQATDVTTQIEPGFMTDWQPLWATLMTQAKGISTIHETIMADRFQYVEDLVSMGASISRFQPVVKHPETVYNFNVSDDRPDAQHAIAITGPTPLKASTCSVKDLRHGATLILAAMSAQGTSTITGIEQVERGYEELANRLRSMGAKITVIKQ